MTSDGTTKHTTEYAKWSHDVEYCFVDIMYDEVLKGNIYTTSFSPLTWSEIRTKLFQRAGVLLNVKQLKGKHNRLKDVWRKYHQLMHSDTGFGWNDDIGLPQAEPIIWQQLEEKHPDFVELRFKPFVHYPKLDVVFAGRAATGYAARASTQRPGPSTAQQVNETEADDMEMGSSGGNTPTLSNTRTTVSGPGKRKAMENEVFSTLVGELVMSNKAIVSKAEKKEAWSISKVINLLEQFGDIDELTFNKALDHFQDETRRQTFVSLHTSR